MVENKSSLFGIIALIIGASGLGLGAFSVVNFQVVEGLPGQDGQDGQDAPGGLVVRILDPDDGETISGNVTIRALIYGSNNYNVSVLLNTTIEIGTMVPYFWNTEGVSDGWWDITVRINDSESNVGEDQILVYVDNSPNFWINSSYGVVVNIYGDDNFAYALIDDVEIKFDILEGESIHIVCSCYNYLYARIEATTPLVYAAVILNFYLDGVQIDYPRVYSYIRNWDGDYANAHNSMYLQEVFQDLSAGPHSVKIRYGYLGYQVSLYDVILFAEIVQ